MNVSSFIIFNKLQQHLRVQALFKELYSMNSFNMRMKQ